MRAVMSAENTVILSEAVRSVEESPTLTDPRDAISAYESTRFPAELSMRGGPCRRATAFGYETWERTVWR